MPQRIQRPKRMPVIFWISWIPIALSIWPGAKSAAFAQAQQSAPQTETKVPPPSGPFHAEGRLTVTTPSRTLRFGEESAIQIQLQGPPVLTLSVSQLQADRGNLGEGEVSIQHRADGQTYVNLVPLGVGKMRLSFAVVFVDGGLDFAEVNVDVLPPIKPPVGLEMESNIYLDLSESRRKKVLWVQARYDVAGKPVYLTVSPKEAHYKVTNQPGDPAIRFDPDTRTIEALRAGHAIIETTYGGLSRATCVSVANGGRNSGECLDLALGLSGGLPSQRVGATSPASGSFRADDRVEFVLPGHPFYLAEDNEVGLTLHGPAVAKIESDQRRCGTDGQSCSGQLYSPYKVLTLRKHPDGKASVDLFPVGLGALEFTLTVTFEDGGVAIKKVRADVVLGTKKPLAIGSSCGKGNYPDSRLPLRLVLHDPEHQEWGSPTSDGMGYLQPSACYEGLPMGAYLPEGVVTYKLKSESPEPVIKLDASNGMATPLHPGQVLVEEEFKGLTREVCVVVAAAEHYQDTDFSNCRGLRSNHAAELTTDFTWPLPPVPEIQGAGPESPGALRYRATALGVLARNVKDAFSADSRVEIPLEDVSLVLGEPTKLPIRLQDPAVLPVNAHQDLLWYTGGLDLRFPDRHDPLHRDQMETILVERQADGSPYLTVTALRPGAAEFRFVFLFADGGVATKTVRLPVVLPPNPPQLVNSPGDILDSGRANVAILHLLPEGRTRKAMLYPHAFFEKGGWGVALGPQDVTFQVSTAGSEPVIDLDKSTGVITALHAGEALIRTGFAGAQLETCVVVLADIRQADVPNCDRLRSAPAAAK